MPPKNNKSYDQVASQILENILEESPAQIAVREIESTRKDEESCRLDLQEQGCVYTFEAAPADSGELVMRGYAPDVEGEISLSSSQIEQLTRDLQSAIEQLQESLKEVVKACMDENPRLEEIVNHAHGSLEDAENYHPLTQRALQAARESASKQLAHPLAMIVQIAEVTAGSQQVAQLMQSYFDGKDPVQTAQGGASVQAGGGALKSLAGQLAKHPSPGVSSASIGSSGGPAFTIRPMAALNAQALGQGIACPSVDERLIYYNRSSTERHMQSQRNEDLTTPHSYMFGVYDQQGKALGTFGLLPYNPGEQRDEQGRRRLPGDWQSGVEIVTYLHEDAQGTGLNTLLKQAQMEAGKALGYEGKMYSSVQDNNPRSVRSMDKHFPDSEKMKITEVMPEYGTERAAYVYRMNSVSAPEGQQVTAEGLTGIRRLAGGYGRWLESLRGS